MTPVEPADSDVSALDFPALDFPALDFPVRRDISDANRRTWQRWREPGTWWTSAERIAIAREVRNARRCALCAERRQALSPYTQEGTHDASGELPEAIVDVVHRLAADAKRLTRKWFDGVVPGTLSAGHYVELLSTVVTLVCIDSFHRAVGAEQLPLPEPGPGEPKQYTPPGIVDWEGWLPMLPEKNATGAEADLYQGVSRTGNVLKAMSLVPDAVRQLASDSAAYYLPLEDIIRFGFEPEGRSLTRAQIELVAGRVSAVNECFY